MSAGSGSDSTVRVLVNAGQQFGSTGQRVNLVKHDQRFGSGLAVQTGWFGFAAQSNRVNSVNHGQTESTQLTRSTQSSARHFGVKTW
ncbi:hypothetical protein Hdeb2414_s0011g00363911 [Helianthus debilis subsp. tardiflorus]